MTDYLQNMYNFECRLPVFVHNGRRVRTSSALPKLLDRRGPLLTPSRNRNPVLLVFLEYSRYPGISYRFLNIFTQI